MNNANQTKPLLDRGTGRIIVAAASARALAASSLRARRPVSTIDLFADADTVAICGQSNRHLTANQTGNFSVQCESMEQIVQRLEQVLCDPDFQSPLGPPTVLVGGGLENYFRNLSTSHELMNQTNAFVFPETACWRRVNEFCRRNSIRFPSTTRKLDSHQNKRRWLSKTEFSSGGLGVQFAQANVSLKPDQYLQEYIEGQSISACYVVTSMDGDEKVAVAEMLGVCEPVPSSDLEARGYSSDHRFPFRYAGSIGPINPARLTGATLAEFKRVGSLVANHFGLVGVFGIDFVLEQDCLWLLEINPRITASAELIEYAAREIVPDFSIVQLHLDARSGKLDRKSASIATCQEANALNRIFAKRIVYRHHEATQTLCFTQALMDGLEGQFGNFAGGGELPPAPGESFITDVPKLETDIVAGCPILTLHVSGESDSAAEGALACAFEKVETIFGRGIT